MIYKGLPHKFSLFLVPACRFEGGGCSWKRGKRFRAWQGISCSPWVSWAPQWFLLQFKDCGVCQAWFCAAKCGILAHGVWWDGWVHPWSQQSLKVRFELVWSSWEGLAGPQGLQGVQSGMAEGASTSWIQNFSGLGAWSAVSLPLGHLRLCCSSRLLGACTVSWECSCSSLTCCCWSLVLILG